MIRRNLERRGRFLIIYGLRIIGCDFHFSTQVTDPSRQLVNRSNPHRTFRLIISIIAASQSEPYNSYGLAPATAPPLHHGQHCYNPAKS
jgi:hypothetical protein